MPPVLSLIFNKSLQTGEIPNDWLSANISPIFKGGDRNKPGNYRPVSLTCICSKILEHIIVSSICKHAESHSIFSPEQYGFRSKRSCESALITFIHDIAHNMQGGGQTDLIIMDFSKAFDKVPHRHLLQKLEYYGIKGQTQLWIKNFLTNRNQRVVVDGASSEWTHVDSGVLGPILSVLFINDLPDYVNCGIKLFADDCILYRHIKSINDTDILQRNLNQAALWEQTWLMKFNPDKCKTMHITRSRNPTKTDYVLHGVTLERVEHSKYLGVTLSNDLSWNRHINLSVKKASNRLKFINRNLHSASKNTKTTAYFTLVRSIVEYASVVWDPHYDNNISNLEMVQRSAARFVCNRYHNTSSVTSMLNQLGWPSLEARRRQARLTFMYKIVNM